MCDPFIALFLGIIQGLTEFLPISSSGHLVLFQGFFKGKWMGDILFDVSVHMGTTLAIIVFFFKDIINLIRGVLPNSYNRDQVHIIICLLITTLVTGTMGVLFRDAFEAMFSNPTLVACMLLITGCLTFFTDRFNINLNKDSKITPANAVMIGLFQGFAIIPGISRSGSTIFAGVAGGLDRSLAAKYSFLAAIPAVLGAAALEWSNEAASLNMLHIVGAASAFIIGLISLRFLVWTLKRRKFFVFSIYCWIIGSIYLIY
ncbi:MAG: undecaprenyl-diphosphate phosphatase [Deltaproteobacteria bacterium]|nr:undecaprenyl-diphosphate phosphatase [Deltaproteobacteria bacterium]